jgi:rare lipoprotein A
MGLSRLRIYLVHLAKEAQHAARDGEGVYKVGKPYQVNGVWYYPKEEPDYDKTGIASWYGEPFHGRRTANGEIYDMNALTAAHKTLPMPTFVRVTNLENGRSLVLKVNDRGPFVNGRIIDISRRGAQLLGFHRNGTAKVRVTALAQERPADSRQFVASKPETPPEQKNALPALPRDDVSVVSLAPPGTGPSAPAGPDASAARVASSDASAVPAKGDEVEIVKVKPNPSIYVQAGVFGSVANANRLKAQLAYIGPANISSVFIKDQEFFRVRIGPLFDVGSADATLQQVLNEGVSDAIVIVE